VGNYFDALDADNNGNVTLAEAEAGDGKGAHVSYTKDLIKVMKDRSGEKFNPHIRSVKDMLLDKSQKQRVHISRSEVLAIVGN